ncbi:unnamed protein product [Linum tenue]|uniref:LOB domain-containing protein n=1 Tax=Linum tenue TaxID=586396 RepID=A0AAV0JQL6_9ROSI|nr:unnamed protein product [Linum tenue]
MERISCNNNNNNNNGMINISNANANHVHQQQQHQQNVVSPISVPCYSSYNSPSPSPPSHHSSSSTSPTTTTFASPVSNRAAAVSNNQSSSETANGGFPPSPPHHHQQHVILSPCAACKILRRRCVDKCVLAPYFPPTDPLKFTIAHRVFGASNIIKFLQELPEAQRADAVSSMVYEANARIRDPVYGCAGAICQLQKQIGDLQAQLAKAQAEVVSMQTQQANLVALIYMEMAQTTSSLSNHQEQQQHLQSNSSIDTACFLDETNLGASWEPLWT